MACAVECEPDHAIRVATVASTGRLIDRFRDRVVFPIIHNQEILGFIGRGILGALHHKGLGLDKADRDRIATELGDGKAAVGVLAPVAEADAVTARLTELGEPRSPHEVADEDLEEAHAAATPDSS